MSRHVTYRGITVDMDSLRRENEKVPAIGNMRVNARGDEIKGGVVTKTADQIARDNHRVQTAVIKAGLKGPVGKDVTSQPEPVKPTATAKQSKKETKEVEQPNGDIIIEGDSNEG